MRHAGSLPSSVFARKNRMIDAKKVKEDSNKREALLDPDSPLAESLVLVVATSGVRFAVAAGPCRPHSQLSYCLTSIRAFFEEGYLLERIGLSSPIQKNTLRKLKMGDSSDFTFCKVGSPVDDDHLESPKTIPDIKKITLNDNTLDGISIPKINNSIQIDSSSDNKFKLKKPATKETVREPGDLVTESQEQKPVIKKSIVRSKVPFEKGYSQMDWLKLTRTHPDLAGLKGQSNRRLISMDEVRQHKAEGSIWTVLKGRVYNISPYMKFHPGGVDMLMKAAGKDCTSLFNKYHAWVNAEFLLDKCLVGVLDESR